MTIGSPDPIDRIARLNGDVGWIESQTAGADLDLKGRSGGPEEREQ
jgi:hypothetical protein